MKKANDRAREIRHELDEVARLVEKAWKRHEQDPRHEDQPLICPGVGLVGRCTDTAVYLAERLGGVVYGYTTEDNPKAEIAPDEGGHDFAVIDDRWLLDFWAKDTYQKPDLYDMTKPKEKRLVRRLYGDPIHWTRMSQENFLDYKKQIKEME